MVATRLPGPGDSSISACATGSVGRRCKASKSAALLFVVNTDRIDFSAVWQTCGWETCVSTEISLRHSTLQLLTLLYPPRSNGVRDCATMLWIASYAYLLLQSRSMIHNMIKSDFDDVQFAFQLRGRLWHQVNICTADISRQSLVCRREGHEGLIKGRLCFPVYILSVGGTGMVSKDVAKMPRKLAHCICVWAIASGVWGA